MNFCVSERQIDSFSINDVKEVEPLNCYSYYLWSCMFKQFCCFGLQWCRCCHYLQRLTCSSAIEQETFNTNLKYLFIYPYTTLHHTPECFVEESIWPKGKLFSALSPFFRRRQKWNLAGGKLYWGWGEQKKILLYCLDQDISMWNPVSHRLQKQTKTSPFEPLAMWLAP